MGESKVSRADHPAAAVTRAFSDMRESCPHYQGIKEEREDRQCTHADNECPGAWCAIDACPLLHERARYESLGWD